MVVGFNLAKSFNFYDINYCQLTADRHGNIWFGTVGSKQFVQKIVNQLIDGQLVDEELSGLKSLRLHMTNRQLMMSILRHYQLTENN